VYSRFRHSFYALLLLGHRTSNFSQVVVLKKEEGYASSFGSNILQQKINIVYPFKTTAVKRRKQRRQEAFIHQGNQVPNNHISSSL